jgi:hypothetical protein
MVVLSATDAEDCCICQPYHVNKDYVGPVKGSVVTQHPLDYCDKMVGFRTAKDENGDSPWGSVTIWIQSMYEWLKAKKLIK